MAQKSSALPAKIVDPEKLEQLRDQFIQNVSHELRTPLAIVRGYAELLQEGELGTLDAQQQQAMLVITNQAQQLTKMVERIGILLSIQTHKMLRMPVRLDTLATQIIEQHRRLAEAAGLVLEYTQEPGALTVLGDTYHLTEALAGLVENAIKFTPRGGHISVSVAQQGSVTCFDVADTGIGISESRLGELFEDFYQVDGSSTRRYGGIGLGLTLARSVVEAHGGYLEVQSEQEMGSRFRVCFPEAEPAHAVVNAPLSDEQAEDHNRLWRVLVVDDEEAVAATLQAGLQKLPDFDVTTATNGKQALQLLQARHFDLLITDYRMPVMDGMSLAAHAREACPWIAIIMVTAYGNEELSLQASRIAIQQILSKPVKLAEIREIATQTLKRPAPMVSPKNGV